MPPYLQQHLALSATPCHLACNEAGCWRAVFLSFPVGSLESVAAGWGAVSRRIGA